MEHIRWSDKSITLRHLVDNPAIRKPALVLIGTKSYIVGDKINGQFIVASSCKISNEKYQVDDEDILLSSKHKGVWKVLSCATGKANEPIHRLTTADIEGIFKQDIINQRLKPRRYLCTKDMEAIELCIRNKDATNVSGQRIEKRIKFIKENTEFEIEDAGEVEYTPSEGERTSQDYIPSQKNLTQSFLRFFISNPTKDDKLVRNRLMRSLYCTTKNERHENHFLLQVTHHPCDIYPIASEGSIELRYLQSTQNIFDYMLGYEISPYLYVKLLRGEPPAKSAKYNGCMAFKSILNGEKIPICGLNDLDMSVVDPNFSVRVRLPNNPVDLHLIPEVRSAELKCMQLSLTLLSHHESGIFINVNEQYIKKDSVSLNETDLISTRAVRNSLQLKRNKSENPEDISDSRMAQSKFLDRARGTGLQQTKAASFDEKLIRRPVEPITSRRTFPPNNALSNKLNRNGDKHSHKDSLRGEQRHAKKNEEFNEIIQKRLEDKRSSFQIRDTKENRA